MFEDQNEDGYGNEDSFFLPLDFNEPADQAGRFNLPAQGSVPTDDPPFWEGQFHWTPNPATLEDGSPAEYDVPARDVGLTLDFNVATARAGQYPGRDGVQLGCLLDPGGPGRVDRSWGAWRQGATGRRRGPGLGFLINWTWSRFRSRPST